jgi:xylulose-5-phosphate/fructose-6-phosphate phosphoketolase
VNISIAMPRLAPDGAIAHRRAGASIRRRASTDGGERPDVVPAASGVCPTAEAPAATRPPRREVPELRVRAVNVTDPLILGPDSHRPHGLSAEAFDAPSTADRPVLDNFHGDPSAVKQLPFERPRLGRFTVNGYIEEGTTHAVSAPGYRPAGPCARRPGVPGGPPRREA